MAYGSEDYWMSSSRLMATLMTAIKDAIIEGSGLFEKLDAIDGGLDGIITLADLNSGECDLLATMLGIETSVEDGGDLINKLDALDGTMDGKLTLAELNVSSVKTNLDTCVTKLTDAITELTTQVTKLTNIETNTGKADKVSYVKVSTNPDTIFDVTALSWGAGIFEAITSPANTANITFTLKFDAATRHTLVVAPGKYKYLNVVGLSGVSWNFISVVAASGTQYYNFMNPYVV